MKIQKYKTTPISRGLDKDRLQDAVQLIRDNAAKSFWDSRKYRIQEDKYMTEFRTYKQALFSIHVSTGDYTENGFLELSVEDSAA